MNMQITATGNTIKTLACMCTCQHIRHIPYTSYFLHVPTFSCSVSFPLSLFTLWEVFEKTRW